MAKLKLSPIADDKPVKVAVELPASLHRDLIAYAEILGRRVRPTADRSGSTDRSHAGAIHCDGSGFCESKAGTASSRGNSLISCDFPIPAMDLAISRSRCKAGLSFCGDQTAQKGRSSPTMGRNMTPGNCAAVVASLVTVKPRPSATRRMRLSRPTA